MKPIKRDTGLTSCPFCSGTAGFRYIYAERCMQSCNWAGEPVAWDTGEALFLRKSRCSDCNKIVEHLVTEES